MEPESDRIELGKKLRGTSPRRQHGHWKPNRSPGRAVELLKRSDRGRIKALLPIRYGRMVSSPFAFFRGSAGVMAADLATTPVTGLRVQACGDCHLVNFGGFATPEREVIFDVNDFDESLPAPWEWDLKRLAASMVLAARSNGLTASSGREAAVASVASYREHLHKLANLDPLECWYQHVTADHMIALMPRDVQSKMRKQLAKAAKTTGSELELPKLTTKKSGTMRITERPPLIFHPSSARAKAFGETLRTVRASYRRSLTDERRALFDRFKVVDASIKVVGVGSVGMHCWVVLLMSENGSPLFLQVKEATASVLEPFAGASRYAHAGQRVVEAQRLMQPVSDIFLGWATGPAGRHFYLRQLNDAKIKPAVEELDHHLLQLYGRACGATLARSHAKGTDVTAIASYLGNSGHFDEAVGDFAVAYADQTERDHAALASAVKHGVIPIEAVE